MFTSLTFILLVFFSLAAEGSNQCADQAMVAVIKNHLVNYDPFEKAIGTYSDLWVASHTPIKYKCSYSFYKRLKDGKIKETLKLIKNEGGETAKGRRYFLKTSTAGEFDIWKNINIDKESAGKLYIFHADEYVLGFFICGKEQNTSVMGIQFNSKKMGLLLAFGGNELKTSLLQAEDKMNAIYKEYGKSPQMTQYPLQNVCPK